MEGDAVSLLLDTATWLNGFMIPEVLPARIREMIGRSEVKKLCSISLLEAADPSSPWPCSDSRKSGNVFSEAVADDIELIDLNSAVAAATNDFAEDFPGDPFDRTIAATAKVFELTLVTADTAIRDARFCKVEFYPFRPSRRVR